MSKEMIDFLVEHFGANIEWSEENMISFAEKIAAILAEIEIASSASLGVIGLIGILLGVWFIKKCVSVFIKVILVLGIVGLLVLVATQSIDIYTAITDPEKLLDIYMSMV